MGLTRTSLGVDLALATAMMEPSALAVLSRTEALASLRVSSKLRAQLSCFLGECRMSNEKHSQIAQRAREIWQREGRPEGRAAAHWKQAEEELTREAEKTGSSKQSAPYVPSEEPMIEPAADSPVIAGVSVPSEPPVPAAEAEQRKSAPAGTSEEKSAPYVPSDEPMIEPDADSPVIAGASVPSKPPIPAAEAEERKRAAAAPAKPADSASKAAATKTPEPDKAGSKSSPSKHSDDKKTDAKKKKKG